MFSLKITWIRIGKGAGTRRLRRGIHQPVDGIARFDAGVLIDDRIDGSAEQEPPGVLGQFVADEDDFARFSRFLERPRNAARPPADIVDAGQVAVAGKQCLGFAVSALGVVPHFAQLDHVQAWKLLRENVAKAHFALFMAAITEAAGEQRHLRPARPDEAPEEMTGEPARRSIVDADIADPRNIGDVRDHGEHRNARCRDFADRFPHRRMIDRDDPYAMRRRFELEERGAPARPG